ncbi:uncharacterized protein LOC111698495 [Eurytemora carolleeae]|uniref:uncharacterized protein LOC111698495 n=1 Tax=Eurytemora carolleeae TaxID=1294199 RepID=UPI000C78232D|nr:uncharacterized protein LOC111698495 [Eurytemora carolleeae]|eukprot:XP_023324617.1 uncharacterized protein LOC111698495 [Eurytemora affinis]
MGLVVSSAVAAGPLVIDHLEVPLNLHEKKGKRKKDNKKFELKNRVSEKQIKVQENKFHNKETHSKSKENISKVNENAVTVQNKNDSRGISALNSRPSSRSSFGSPIKKNKIKFAQYNPVEKYLTSYIGKYETDSKENKDMRLQPGPDDSLGDKDTQINQNTLQVFNKLTYPPLF